MDYSINFILFKFKYNNKSTTKIFSIFYYGNIVKSENSTKEHRRKWSRFRI